MDEEEKDWVSDGIFSRMWNWVLAVRMMWMAGVLSGHSPLTSQMTAPFASSSCTCTSIVNVSMASAAEIRS